MIKVVIIAPSGRLCQASYDQVYGYTTGDDNMSVVSLGEADD